jgi:hypothetical protein
VGDDHGLGDAVGQRLEAPEQIGGGGSVEVGLDGHLHPVG